MEQSPSSEANSRSTRQEILPPLMEPEGSLLRSQEPASKVLCNIFFFFFAVSSC